MAELYTRTNSPYWQARLTVGGETVRKSMGRGFEIKTCRPGDAQRAADQWEAEAEADFQFQANRGLTLKDAAKRFLAETDLRPRTIKNYEYSLKNLEKHFGGDIALNQITREGLREFVILRWRRDGAPTAAKRDIAFLSSLCNASLDWPEARLKENPVLSLNLRRLKMPRTKPRQRVLSQVEMKIILEHEQDDWYRAMLLLGYDQGFRVSEILGFQIPWINHRHKVVVLPDDKSKTHVGRTVPLSQRTYDTLCRVIRRNIHPVWLFYNPDTGRPVTTVKTWVETLRQKSKIYDWSLVTLRHTFDTNMIAMKTHARVTMDIMGHEDERSHLWYGKSTPEMLREAIDEYEAKHTL